MPGQDERPVSELAASESLTQLIEIGRLHEKMGVELVDLRNENGSLRQEINILRHDGERLARDNARLILERDRATAEVTKLNRLYGGSYDILRTAGSLLLDKAEQMKAEEGGEHILPPPNVEKIRAVKTA